MTTNTAPTTRTVRWVEVSADPKLPIHWNQSKKVEISSRKFERSTDRHSDYVQSAEGKRVYKYPKAVREGLREEAKKVTALLEKLADGKVAKWTYSPAGGVVNYEQQFEAGGDIFQGGEATQDETILEAAEHFLGYLIQAVQTVGKPLAVEEVAAANVEPGEPEEPDEA